MLVDTSHKFFVPFCGVKMNQVSYKKPTDIIVQNMVEMQVGIRGKQIKCPVNNTKMY